MKHNIILLIIAFSTLLISCNKKTSITNKMEETFYVRNGGSDMSAFVRGNGASKVFILLLHGGPGGSGLEYRSGEYAQLVEEKYAMVYWDQRHSGNSHGHLDQNEVTLDIMVEDVQLMVKTIKKRYGNDISLFLMGHSWGGMLGTAYMTTNNYQTELAGWIDIDGAHDVPLLYKESIKMMKEIGTDEIINSNNIESWNKILAYLETLDPSKITNDQASKLNRFGFEAIDLMATELSQPKDEKKSAFKSFFLSPSNKVTVLGNSGQMLSFFDDKLNQLSLTNNLHKIVTPTLLLWGKYDFVVPPALADVVYENISSEFKFLKIYEHAGHSPMAYEPMLFIEDLVSFIEEFK